MLRRRIVSSLATAALLIGGGALSPAFASVQTSQENVGDILGAPAAVEKSTNERIAAWQKLQFGLFMHWGSTQCSEEATTDKFSASATQNKSRLG